MHTPATLAKKSTKRVLIIEDEGEMCLLLNIILDGKEMELDHVQDLEHATSYLEKQKPSVVILDNRLPDGFGVDYISHIKKNYPGIGIIMISGYGSAAKDIAIANGADMFIEKPFTRDQLYQSIEKVMEAAQA